MHPEQGVPRVREPDRLSESGAFTSRVLVTGGSGFIGLALAERLAARGDRVRALVRRTSRTAELSALGAELAFGALDDRPSLAAAVDGCDLVVHLAGATKALHAADLFRVNAEGTRNLAVACAMSARPPVLVHVSSLAAAGPALGGRARTEEDLPAPVSLYGESKLAGEVAVREVSERLPATIVRPPVVYGPRDRELVPQLLRMARLGVVVRAGAQKRYSTVHVADLCDALLLAAERGRRVARAGTDGIYFVDDGAEHTWDEIALAAFAALGRSARIVPVPESASLLAAAAATALARLSRTPSILSFDKVKELRQAAWTCSSRRAANELGYAPRWPLADGMRETVAWFRSSAA